MKKLLLKSMFILLGLVVGVNTAVGQEKEYTTVYSNTYSTDGECARWVSANTDRYTVGKGGDETNYYMLVSSVKTGNNGTTITSTELTTQTMYLESTDYKIDFDFNMNKSNNQAAYFQIFDNNGTELAGFYQQTAGDTPVDIKSRTGDVLGTYNISYTAGTFNHVTITSNATEGTKMTFTPVDGEPTTYTLSNDMVYVGKMAYNTKRYYGAFCFDNLVAAIYSDEVITPSISITKINGVERTIKIESTVPTYKLYYYIDDDSSNPIEYTEPFVMATSGVVHYYAMSGAQKSDEQTFDVVCQDIILVAPTSYRTGADSYKLTATQTAVDGLTAVPTIHYTIGDGAEQTVANGGTITGVNGDIKAWAVADGYTTSESVTTVHVAAYETTEIWSYNLNSFPSTYAITSIASAIDEATAKTFDEVTYYNLKNIERPNFYVGTGAGWLLRNQAKSAFKVQSNAENIIFDNVYPGLVIYINGVEDQGRYRINNVTNGEVKYYYNNNEYFIVPTTAGAVTVRFGTGVSLNNISVGYINGYTFTKSIPAMGYASFSAPSAVTVPEGVSVYKAAVNAENTAVKLTKVETAVIPANTGVILGAAEGSYDFVITDEASEADFSDNALIATSVEANATVPTEGTYYALKANAAEFAKVKAGLVISGNKAYLKASDDSGAKLYSIVFDEDDDATGINDVNAAVKGNGAYYTLQGVKVAAPTKGLYIVNGKKVVIK